jgi:hypothetical protein
VFSHSLTSSKAPLKLGSSMPLQRRRSKSGRKAKGSSRRLVVKPIWRRRALLVLVALVGALAVAVWVWVMMGPVRKAPSTASTPKSPYPSLQELVAMTREQLAGVDIAVMNLRCAEGLRGAEGLDIPATLKVLDRYADHVEKETTRHLHRFRKNPEEFQNSEPYFRMMMMATVLQEDFAVRYNPARITSAQDPESNAKFYADAKDVFVHGLAGPPTMGTCSSMPVFYVAIGRRLGYPVFLVPAKGHLFVRWEDGSTRMNIDATTRGMISEPDDFYKGWPNKVEDAEIEPHGLFKSMTAREELAAFLAMRGACFYDGMGHWVPGIAAYRDAARLAPQIRTYRMVLEMAQARLRARQVEQMTWLLDHPGEPMPAALRAK